MPLLLLPRKIRFWLFEIRPQEVEDSNAQLVANLRLFSLEVQEGSASLPAAAGGSKQDGDEGGGGGEDLSVLQSELAKQVRRCECAMNHMASAESAQGVSYDVLGDLAVLASMNLFCPNITCLESFPLIVVIISPCAMLSSRSQMLHFAE